MKNWRNQRTDTFDTNIELAKDNYNNYYPVPK